MPEAIEASPEQRRLWFVDRHEGGGRAYVVPLAWWMSGRYDFDALAAAVDALVARHEALRCALAADGDRVSLTVRTPPRGLLQRAFPATKADLDAEFHEFVAQPLDLGRGEVLRARLWTLPGGDALLSLTVHHALVDGRSEVVIADDLWSLYRGDALPVASSLTEAVEQQGPSRAAASAPDALEYWLRALAGVPAVLGLPLDRPRTADPDWRGGVTTVGLTAQEHQDLARLARQSRTTGFVITVACLGVFLARWCNETDLVIGVPFGTDRPGRLEQAVGFFDNTLPIRLDLTGNPSFTEVVRRAKARVVEAMAHRETPLDAIIQSLRLDRTAGTPPLFQVMLTYEGAPPAAYATGTGEARRVAVYPCDAKLDLVVHVTPGPEVTDVRFEYRTALFDDGTIARAARCYLDVVRQCLADPAVAVGDLRLPALADRSDAAAGTPALVTVSEPAVPTTIAQAVREDPGAVAVRSGQRTLTRGELWAASSRLAAQLRDAGVGDGAPVGSLVSRGVEIPVAILGIWLAGGVYVPLDPDNPTGRNTFILDDAGVSVVVADGPVPEAARRTLVRLGEGAARAGSGVSDPDLGTVAYIMYTSGSTGRPKGVMIEHGSLAGLLAEMRRIVRPGPRDTVVAATTVTFDISLVELLLPLTAGAECVVADAPTAADPIRLAGLIGDAGATIVQATPSVWRLLLQHLARPVRVALCGGEPLVRDVQVGLLTRAERAINVYGPTETTIWSSAWPVADGPISIGEPLRNNRFLVMDQWGRPAPAGVWGELWINGPALTRGYVGRRELDAAAFVTLPGVGRCYRTGDRARRTRTGRYEVSGRIDDQLKIRGFRIEPREVERALNTLPGVGGSVVVPLRVNDNLSLGALVTGDGAGSPGDAVERWRIQWDAVYEGLAESEFTGWVSSITRQPYSDRLMAEWADHAVATLTQLGFERVLEIGAGSGILTRRLAATAKSWLATESSPRAVEHLRTLLGGVGDTLVVAPGSADLVGSIDQQFDLVILNSVVQYFPDRAYLDSVLTRCLERLLPGGHLFVGDVRSLALAPAQYRAMAEAAAEGAAEADLASAVEQLAANERELLIAPGYFAQLARERGDVALALRPKHLRGWSEMAAFRFDAILRNSPGPARPGSCAEYSWTSLAGFERICALVRSGQSEAVVRRIPNAHNAAWLGPGRGADAVTPPALTDAARAHGCVALVGVDDDPTLICAYLAVSDAVAGRRALWEATHRTGGGEVSVPHQSAPSIPGPADITERLRHILPPYMVPSVVVPVPALPLLPSGKADRRRAQQVALDHLAAAAPPPETTPVDAVEAAVRDAWARVLGRSVFAAADDFFRLGGDSLAAVRMLADLRRRTAVEIRLSAFLRASSFGVFCSYVRTLVDGRGERLDRDAS